jgi:hypothetical protein
MFSTAQWKTMWMLRENPHRQRVSRACTTLGAYLRVPHPAGLSSVEKAKSRFSGEIWPRRRSRAIVLNRNSCAVFHREVENRVDVGLKPAWAAGFSGMHQAVCMFLPSAHRRFVKG